MSHNQRSPAYVDGRKSRIPSPAWQGASTEVTREGREMADEPQWMGHPSAQRRMLRNGDTELCEYLDPDNQSLALMLRMFTFRDGDRIFNGADLWALDEFVEQLEVASEPRAARLRAALNEIRTRFKREGTSGDITKNDAWRCMHNSAEFIGLMHVDEPLVKEGLQARKRNEAQIAGAVKGGKLTAQHRKDSNAARDAKIRLEELEMLRSGVAVREIAAKLATRHGLGAAQIRRILKRKE
ncbi:hypothetical protein K7N18_10365 [Burkholderia arboris]|uniref:hypothetical protein n=1 Tax=Burkholderia arboris TaxID=488730 RepID=UPI001CA43C77|nr:hypothetical protein [Burkholderia arboris]MBY8605241.1 hypothetical protein [Burkholderia arboris]